MSNQAAADGNYNDNPGDSAGLADAGAGFDGVREGRESEPGSATNQYPGSTSDAAASAGPGHDARADVPDDMNAIDAYRASLEQLDIDNMPLGDEAPPVETADEVIPQEPEAPTDPEEEDYAKNWRVNPTSPLDARVFALMKADKTLDVEAAVDLARASLKMPPRQAADSTPDPTTDQGPRTTDEDEVQSPVSEIESQIRDLRRQAVAAKRAYDADTEADLEEQILNLEEQLPELRAREEGRRRLAEEEDAAWNESSESAWQQVVTDYPQAADPDGAMALLMLKRDDDLRQSGDPLYGRPDKAVEIAKWAAAKLGINSLQAPAARQPVSNGRALPAPASSRTSAPAPRPGPVVIAPASGSARTAADTPTQLEVDIQRAQTPEDYERLRERALANF